MQGGWYEESVHTRKEYRGKRLREREREKADHRWGMKCATQPQQPRTPKGELQVWI
jgi:hypothetical protein